MPDALADPLEADDHDTRHRTMAELEAGLDDIRRSPREAGTVDMLVIRPAESERTTPIEARLTVEEGLEGDTWRSRGSRRTEDGSAHPDMQVALLNRRLLHLLAGTRERWPLAGDQLVVDLDLGVDHLRPGDELLVGDARVVVTEQRHTGCAKFSARYGRDALRFVHSPVGRELRLRGMYVRVLEAGTVRVGDQIRRMSARVAAAGPGAARGG